MNPLRIPFAEAIREPRLLQSWWENDLSAAQQVALATFYGLPLDGERAIVDTWTQLDLFAAQQGFGEYDDLGRLVKVTHRPAYVPTEYREGWGIWGIRSGKSDRFASTIVVYEAVCGGHEAFIRPGKQAVCFQICQDLRMARYSLHGIRATLETMPFLQSPYKGKPRVVNVTADRIELWNGLMIATTPPTVKAIRGYDAPVAVLDEVGVWYQDSDSANPDFEVYRNVSSRQAQFEDPKIVGISSPWNKGGILYERFEAGTEGRRLHCQLHPRGARECPACERLRRPHKGRVVLFAPTPAMGNPLVKEKWLREEQAKDPRAFEREVLAQFQDSISGFLDGKRLDEAVDVGITERPPRKENIYIAAMDPAFKQDAFAFAVGHVEKGGVQIDLVRQIVRGLGAPPLNPEAVFVSEIVPALQAYKVATVHSDQYHFESLAQLASQHGFAIDSTPFSATTKASIYGNLKQLVNQHRIRLLDHPATLKELRQLEVQLGEQGNVKIAAPRGQHDDLSTVIALIAHFCIWLLPQELDATMEGGPVKDPTIQERFEEQIRSRQIVDGGEAWD
jgi:hypothetical protein